MKPKVRSATERRTAKPKREAYELFLIVCEGSVTEPQYFYGLRDELKLSTANIEVVGEECGSNPVSVVNYAIERFRKNPIFDRVYCVFDRDEHARFADALSRVKAVKLRKDGSMGAGEATCQAITSSPCFEVWVLLHYTYTSRPFARSGSKTASDQVLDAVLKYDHLYRKGAGEIAAKLAPMRATAIRHAIRLAAEDVDNPQTSVHQLVQALQSLKAPG